MNKSTYHLPKNNLLDKLLYKIFKVKREVIFPVNSNDKTYSNIYLKKESLWKYLKRCLRKK